MPMVKDQKEKIMKHTVKSLSPDESLEFAKRSTTRSISKESANQLMNTSRQIMENIGLKTPKKQLKEVKSDPNILTVDITYK